MLEELSVELSFQMIVSGRTSCMQTGQLSPAKSLDDYVEAFERAWQGEAVPRIIDFAPPGEHPDQRQILLEMIRADLEFRSQRECGKSLEQYATEFPELLSDEQALSLLAFEEYRVRRLSGDTVVPADYFREFRVDVARWPKISSVVRTSARASKRRPSNGLAVRMPDAVPEFPAAGTVIGGFHLQQELGRGAFSRVYLARQKDLADRFVVLKLSGEKFAEAEKLAQLQHSNIVPIYSQHQWGDLSAVCMPYFGSTTMADLITSIAGARSFPPTGRAIVETLTHCAARTARVAASSWTGAADGSGGSMRTADVRSAAEADRVSGFSPGPMPTLSYEKCLQTLSGLTCVDAVLWLAERIAAGLDHAHQRGILHHDLKPANVLLADDGRPMLLDFNLSADLKDGRCHHDVHIGGTLPYMAPEQLQGFLDNVPVHDARSDLYSLGVILFELLTGDLPFSVRQGSFREMIPAMISERRESLPSVRQVNREVTPATEGIILKCLAADPTERYQSAEQLQEDLSRQQKHLPLRYQREPSVRERFQKWTQRHPRLSTTINAGGTLLLLAGLVLMQFERRRFHSVQSEISGLVQDGQSALNQDEPELAQGRFLKAWMLAQAEPALQDQLASFAGWLDHSRRATLQRQLKWHVPPRDFEMQRDESLLLCALASKDHPEFRQLAVAAVTDSLTFAAPNDPGWTPEAELLLLAETELLNDTDGPATALKFLEDSELPESNDFHRVRNALRQLAGSPGADKQLSAAEDFPIDQSRTNLLLGVTAARGRDFAEAMKRFEAVLDGEPQRFLPRFLHSVCLTLQQRDAEAEAGLRACLAQRPDFLWTEYFLCVIRERTSRTRQSAEGLRRIAEYSPSPALQQAVESLQNGRPFAREAD